LPSGNHYPRGRAAVVQGNEQGVRQPGFQGRSALHLFPCIAEDHQRALYRAQGENEFTGDLLPGLAFALHVGAAGLHLLLGLGDGAALSGDHSLINFDGRAESGQLGQQFFSLLVIAFPGF